MQNNELNDTKNIKNGKKSIVKSGILLSLMTFASRIMGLVREMTKAKFLGTNIYADSFTTAFMIPNLLRRLFAENAISAAFIPTFKEYLQKENTLENKKKTQEFLASTFTLISFMTACVVVIGIIITPLLMPIFCKEPVDTAALDYAQQVQYWLLQKSEITILTRIMFPYLFLISVAAFFQGVLNGCNIFAPSGFTPVLFNLTVILGTYFFAPYTKDPAVAMSIGVIAGGTIQALFQWPFIRKTGWKVTFTTLKKTFSNPGTKKVIALIAPTVIGMAAYQLNDLVCTSLATRTAEGIASSLQYSLRMQELILGIFAVSIGTVILPDMSSYAIKKEWDEFNNILVQAIKIMILISIPVTFYSLINGKELITLLYKNKTFDDKSVLQTLGVFNFHMTGLVFIALNRVIAPAFYALKQPKLPTFAGIISFVVNIIFAFVLVIPMKGEGIALALTIASAVNTIFLFIYMKKIEFIKVGKVIKGTVFYSIKIIIFSVIASVPCCLLHEKILTLCAGHGKIISFGGPILIQLFIFGVIGVFELIVTKDPIVLVILKKLKRK